MQHQHLLPLQHLLKLHLPQRPPPPTLLQLLPLQVLWKPQPVLLPTLLLLAPPMLPKPLSTLLLKLPKPLPSLHSNRFIRVWYPSTKSRLRAAFLLCICSRWTHLPLQGSLQVVGQQLKDVLRIDRVVGLALCVQHRHRGGVAAAAHDNPVFCWRGFGG